jgi:pimeloyl-ACP methyl ester carboxylesterase
LYGTNAPPSVALLASEPPRAALELAALLATGPLLQVRRRGDGHPVLVLPGLLGGDISTLVLRAYLSSMGYTVSGWSLGTNIGPTQAVVDGLRRRLADLHQASGRPVSVIGWSLGGLYAHELARKAPSQIRQVITLGSPVRLARPGQETTSRLFDRYSHLQVAPSLVPRPWTEAGSLRVPATALYTRGDGIVAWQSCLLPPGPQRENIEVSGSHLGLAHNPQVLHVLADRLAQPEGKWKPYRPGRLSRLRRALPKLSGVG